MTVLEQLGEAERYERYDALQARMVDVWRDMRQGHGDESVVVVPSVSVDRSGTPPPSAVLQAMEERSLFLLLLLRQPRLRLVYVTSMPIPTAVVDYYLGLLPGVVRSQALPRLTMIALGDASPRPLSEKLLARPRALQRVRDALPNPARSHLVPYNTTSLERDVALSLGIPVYGADPRLLPFGTKTGCRRLFEAVGIAYPLGEEAVHDVDEVVAALVRMRARRPGLQEVVVKLDDGVSGRGNALVDLRGLPPADDADLPSALRERVLGMRLEAPGLALEEYLGQLAGGGIVEERIVGRDLLSPSVQLRVLPGGEVELLSTHDQMLGGESGQSYLGCVFPADPAYARAISEPALRVAERLSALGVLGRFAVDFVVVRDGEGEPWQPYAIELNLRKGGTTHPFLTLQYLTDGTYDWRDASYRTHSGAPKHLVATDHLESPLLRALTVDDLLDVVTDQGLHFDQSTRTGVVLHMLTCVTEVGRVGVTAVGDTPEQAQALFRRTEEALLAEAAEAARAVPLPG
ncbi:peptide ligase PGM1-related protein [Aquipuribacter nitratireducens]|uniref:Peptide ligase PGM1-related protein n=1 Tax=Aquipuribacter nitratireducens TaxID=650104 RepID=A0ABW0GJ69_9MICO